MPTNPTTAVNPVTLGVAEYVRIACLRNDLAESTALLIADHGLPQSKWTAAHEAAITQLAKRYDARATHVTKKRPASQAWMSPFTFEKGTREQRALSRVCELITGKAQEALRQREAAKAAEKEAEQARLQAANAMSAEEKEAARQRDLRSGISSVFQGLGARLPNLEACEVEALREGVRYLSLLLTQSDTKGAKTPTDPAAADTK